MSLDDKNREPADLLLEVVGVEPELRKRAKITSDFDLLMKKSKKKATRKFVMWMIILVVFAAFVIVGSVLLFDNLAELSIKALE